MTTPMTFDQLFTYGQTRERYAIPSNECINSSREILSLVRKEHLATLRQAMFQDQPLLENRSGSQWQLQLSPMSRQCLWEIHSGIFLRLLENITSHTQLLPDAKCHFLELHTQTHSSLHLKIWQDQETGLPIVLYMLLGLDSGNAILISKSDESIAIKEPTLQIAFFYFSGTPA